MNEAHPNLLKHLEFIQVTLNRMAANSFIVKGWSVTLVAAILAFTTKDGNPHAALIALLPALMFWGLDGYFLRNEKLYRQVYDQVCEKRNGPDSEVDFSLDTTDAQGSVRGWFSVTWSKTLWPFYLALVGVILIVWRSDPVQGDKWPDKSSTASTMPQTMGAPPKSETLAQFNQRSHLRQ